MNANDASPEYTNFIEILCQRAEKTPDQVAYLFLGDGENVTHRLNYAEIDQQARAIARLLLAQGSPGDRVLLAYGFGLDFIPAFFGSLYAGMIAVPLPEPRATLERWLGIQQACQASLALGSGSFIKQLREKYPADSPLRQLTWLATDQPLEEGIGLDPSKDIDGNSPAFLQYTSGSTGAPKGVVVSHDNMIDNARTMQAAFNDIDEEKGFSWLPFYHDMGLTGGMLQPMFLGVPMMFMSPLHFLQRPRRWLQAISRYRITSCGAPDFAYKLCTQKIRPEQMESWDLSCWQQAMVGAEPVQAETLAQFSDHFGPCGFNENAFFPGFGMAEATLFMAGRDKQYPVTTCRVDAQALTRHEVVPLAADTSDQTYRFVSNGITYGSHRLLIVDPKTHTLCTPDQVGELWFQGGNKALGYWNDPLQTEKTFQAYLADGTGPFLRTGDLGFRVDGELYITGRLKDVIIIRGCNYYPQDLELAVEQSDPALRPAGGVAFSVTTEGAEQLVILQEIERTALRKADPKVLMRTIQSALSTTFGLSAAHIVLLKPGSVLRTSSGKVRRRDCREAFLAGDMVSL
ncbi:fatty acyl-AMP ligase [Magnetococcus sp. PR-3]|uniref:fatty acyl-AMP ligase n=1 Tax=Magnetococcus sp. PR-3 TaxID=3120355 RepID=UPI002FCE2037